MKMDANKRYRESSIFLANQQKTKKKKFNANKINKKNELRTNKQTNQSVRVPYTC